MKPKTGAERQAAHAAKGRAVAFVLTDPASIKALAKLEKRHGGVKAAVSAALAHAAASKD